jgi:diadenosine tetraphosphate (Ap4A) HIT family hydrolase
VSAGLFELRRDPITSWWVATVVDRDYDRRRFARAASLVDDRGDCQNCRLPDAGVRDRTLKDFAFHVVGTEEEGRELDRGLAQVALSDARAAGSWRTIVAPSREHRPLPRAGPIVDELLMRARDAVAAARRAGQTDYVQVVQNWGAEAGARTNHLCLDLYDLPLIPHRVAEELGGAARFVIREGECPWCRLVREESRRPARLVWEDASTVAFAPWASRSPFEVWLVPRRHEADFGRTDPADVAATAAALRHVTGLVGRALDDPPYNLVLHTSPLRERVDTTFHWHWELHPRLREVAGLELGTGLPVNPIAPEDAVEELLAGTAPAVPAGRSGG